MVGHIVMWKLKESADGRSAAENAKRMKEMLEALPAMIPQLRALHLSTDVFAATQETDVVLYTEFESADALQEYQVHPEHKKCVSFISGVVADRRVVDYNF